MIFKVGLLILLLYLLCFDRDCEELEDLLYFDKNSNSESEQKSSMETLPDVNQELSPEEVAQRIFDDI